MLNTFDDSRVWRNNGGVFSEDAPAQLLDTANASRALALGGIDNDGDLDIVIGNDGPPNSVWLNGGDNTGTNTGVFIDSMQALGASRTNAVALGDIDGDGDGDGDLDLVAGNGKNSSTTAFANRVWRNDGGVFTDVTPVAMLAVTEDTEALALVDIDGDGDLDMVVGNNELPNRLLINNINNVAGQEGAFTDSGLLMGENTTVAIAVGDIDGDGDVDLVSGNNFDSNRVWLNDF